ncbi:MAG: hypothetical protein KDH96_02370 [Candidatus Riesia sp.]|nr:hypothetical protein [Candidatus Riesia sp.]
MKGIGCISNSLTDGDTVAQGSGNVFANFLPVSVHNDPTTGHGCFPPSVMISTTGTVFVNNKPVLRHGDSNQPHTCVTPPNPTDSGTLISTSNVTVGD